MQPSLLSATIYVRSRPDIGNISTGGPFMGDVRGRSGAPIGARTLYQSSSSGGASADAEQRTLPEDQQTALELAQSVARERGLELAVVDLGEGRHWLLRRRFDRDGGTRFPLLLGPGSRRLEGPESFTPEAVRKVLEKGLF